MKSGRQAKGTRTAATIPGGGGAARLSLALYSASPYSVGADEGSVREVLISGGFRAANPAAFAALSATLELVSPVAPDANATTAWNASMLLATLSASGDGWHQIIPNVPAGSLVLTVTGAGNAGAEVVDLVLGVAELPDLVIQAAGR